MTVEELRILLKGIAPETEVVLSKDGEGNDYSPLWNGCSEGIYIAENTWSGHFIDFKDKEALENCEHEGPPNTICLWPIN